MAAIVWKNIAPLRGGAIALVVLNHATMAVTGILRGHPLASKPRDVDLVVETILRNITPLCLPMFLFATGYFAGRFQTTWRSAWASIRAIAWRYLLWAIPASVAMALWEGTSDLTRIASSVLSGGPFPAYWFLVLLIQLSSIAPLLALLVTKMPTVAWGIALLVQCIASATCYRPASEIPWLTDSHSPLHNLPFFLFGMLASLRGEHVIASLERARGLLLLGAIACLGLTCAEGVVLGNVLGDGTVDAYVYDPNKITFVFFSLLTIAYFLTAEPRPSRIRTRLNWLGVRSLALLLLVDPAAFAAVRLMWHADRLTGPSVHPHSPPGWVQGTWSVVPIFMAGLFVPLMVVEATERLLGKRAKKFIFG
jgi:surface polysaccharide O-acyltransferase-like enzyme